MLDYFPSNYAWSLTVLIAVEAVGTISEIDDAIRHLKQVPQDDSRAANEEWFTAWLRLGDRLEGLAEQDLERGCLLSAARKLYRSGLYLLMGERFLPHTDPRHMPTYRRGTGNFRRALQMRKDPVEFVDIPYRGGVLPSIFVRSGIAERGPCVIHYGGYDSLKEWVYPVMWDAFRQRGLSLLIVDQPGVGGALRLHNLAAVPEVEHSVSAVIDYLESRPDVDPGRIALEAISLGGYYAPRAAAFEKRLAGCVAWGGIWDLMENLQSLIDDPRKPRSIPNFFEFGKWVFGVDTEAEYFDVARRMTLDGIIGKVECPLLVLHGVNDRQVVARVAERTYEGAINSRRRELKVFTPQTGAVEHCNADNLMLVVDYMADWCREVLSHGDA
jgi:pimeloyl-ACP methyl ester carboxylesterase